ncbi:antibiotic biosynthesis monooxygenase [Amycolatopsis ultiminotia]|uniref:Antibiotic biosynthesis monooxygenase n=1 Tax=Amycolatopsis ultiminotia TaxID=543629 RepID=A0ABP6XAH0_9PSEU
MTYRVMLRMEIKEGMGREFETVWVAIGDSVTSHPANLGQWLSRSEDETGVYYIVSDWVDESGFRQFEKSERHIEHRQKLHPYRSGGGMYTMQVVAHVPSSKGPATHEEWEAAR